MIRIGDFSKLSRISVKTLRYYDQVDLLKPARVDDFTGYRYYTYDQLPRLNRILALKDLGFSLEQIGALLANNLSSEQMHGMLRLRQAETQQQVQQAQDRLARIEARLRLIEQEDVMSNYDVVVRPVDALKVASLRGIIPSYPEQGRLWGELVDYLQAQHINPNDPCLTIYHDDEYKDSDIEVEVCIPVEADLPSNSRIKVYKLAPVECMACTVHHGPFVTIGEAYNAMLQWIEANDYNICGPSREVYLVEANAEGGEQGLTLNQNDPETVTEIQFPVTKA
jgi:DNA-binding transcriptional MerR regulator